jgi:hypothetical protein
MYTLTKEDVKVDDALIILGQLDPVWHERVSVEKDR